MCFTWKAAMLMLAAAMTVPVGLAQSQPTRPASTPKAATAGQQTGSRAMNWREQRMAEREKMMADMKAMDARLQAKVDAMNRAAGPAKESAMAAVLNEMAQQRHEIMAKMAALDARMTAMRGRKMNSAMASSSTCPGMQGAQETKSPKAGTQSKSSKPTS